MKKRRYAKGVYGEYKEKDAWHRVYTTGFPYFNLADVKRIYVVLNNGNANGLELFAQKAKEIAVTKEEFKTLSYTFIDETALFELFCEFFPNKFKTAGISTWGHLMQYIS